MLKSRTIYLSFNDSYGLVHPVMETLLSERLDYEGLTVFANRPLKGKVIKGISIKGAEIIYTPFTADINMYKKRKQGTIYSNLGFSTDSSIISKYFENDDYVVMLGNNFEKAISSLRLYREVEAKKQKQKDVVNAYEKEIDEVRKKIQSQTLVVDELNKLTVPTKKREKEEFLLKLEAETKVLENLANLRTNLYFEFRDEGKNLVKLTDRIDIDHPHLSNTNSVSLVVNSSPVFWNFDFKVLVLKVEKRKIRTGNAEREVLGAWSDTVSEMYEGEGPYKVSKNCSEGELIQNVLQTCQDNKKSSEDTFLEVMSLFHKEYEVDIVLNISSNPYNQRELNIPGMEIHLDSFVKGNRVTPLSPVKPLLLASMIASGTMGKVSQEVEVNDEPCVIKSTMMPVTLTEEVVENGTRVIDTVYTYKAALGLLNILRKEFTVYS